MLAELPYIPGIPPAHTSPLARYLPPIPDGVAAAWLGRHLPLPAGERPWVLDPFGAAPRLAVEAARAGYRLLVAAHNPVARFLLEMAADPPSEADLRLALADLAASFKGEERLEPHIRGLYTTTCARCAQPLMAEAFLWERGASAPYAKLYTCPQCHDQGERPTNEDDAARAARFAAGGLHRARALERIAPQHDPDRVHAEEALEAYLPRAVYALFTLINKLDGLALPPARRKHLAALLLTACDQANSLWPYPTARERPRQIVTPPKFRENNTWLALEAAVAQWAAPPGEEGRPPLPLTIWPALPPAAGGVCIFEGRLKDLAGLLDQVPIGAVLAALPRPNQAFWTLCALWAGWLWGREAIGPFVSVLRRRRYDWAWHTTALAAALEALVPHLPPGTPFGGLVGEAEPGFLAAALIAADASGFDLHGLALSASPRAESGQGQILWLCEQHSAEIPAPPLHEAETPQAALGEYLQKRGEPAGYLHAHTAALAGMAAAHTFRAERVSRAVQESLEHPDHAAEPSLAVMFNQSQAALKETLTYRGGFLRYGAGEAPESGLWWVRNGQQSALPLADRLEMALVNFIIKHPGCTLAELEEALYPLFPGLLTPEDELLHACLESYALPDASTGERWQLRAEDRPAARGADLAAVRQQLQQIGHSLGYSLQIPLPEQRTAPIEWLDAGGQLHYRFYPKASAVLGEIVFQEHSPAERSVIVLPGGRANLVTYKLHRDPHLHQAVEQGWHFLKFRHLRSLLAAPGLTPDTFPEKLEADPLTYDAPQMRLL